MWRHFRYYGLCGRVVKMFTVCSEGYGFESGQHHDQFTDDITKIIAGAMGFVLFTILLASDIVFLRREIKLHGENPIQ
uniref:Uncharacterized protein n=1 Tax=Arion vulgaris TaxID=1028688 RepID=A0A0B6ZEN9_9EUPU